jgi:hypothetical protein
MISELMTPCNLVLRIVTKFQIVFLEKFNIFRKLLVTGYSSLYDDTVATKAFGRLAAEIDGLLHHTRKKCRKTRLILDDKMYDHAQ